MIKNLNKKNKKKGFTLIELIIVIAIIAILAAVALPKFGEVRKNANKSADVANGKTIQGAVTTLIAEGTIDLPTADAGTTFLLDNVVDGGTAAAVGDEKATVDYLQGSLPEAKLGTNKGENFFVKIDKTGTVTITIKTAGGDVVYPQPPTGTYAE